MQYTFAKTPAMNRRILPLLALGITVLPASGCKIDPWAEDCTPKIMLTDTTQVGANTMSCFINGQVWVAQMCPNDPDLGPDVKADWHPPSGGLTLSGARNVVDDVQILTFTVDSVVDEGTYALGPLSSPGWVYYSDHVSGCVYTSDSLGCGGTFTVTKQDRTNYIISGKFEAKLYSPGCSDTIHITHGRFDVRE
jgi:hypothetical protein